MFNFSTKSLNRRDTTVLSRPQNPVSMKFYVRYNNDLKGYVHGYPFVRAITSFKLHLLKLRCKIGVAKGLPEMEEWCYSAIHIPWQHEDDEDIDEDPIAQQERFKNDRPNFWLFLKEHQNIMPIRYTPSQNKFHLFIYQGCLFALYRHSYEKQNSWLAGGETFTIYSFFWNKKVLFTLLKEVQQASIQRRENKITMYRGSNQKNTVSWVSTVSKPPRPLSTLALPFKIKNDMLEDIEEFLSPRTKVWYRSRGIPYRRGYLLYGPPGTGKSSMCFAIAGHLWLDIYTVSLNSRKLDEDILDSLF
ncbi:ATPase AAA-type core [Penicillium soppii]|uniref:ATPase AAA-type core n=1 Tax=Penicillium soppii TaxID=69789 RepID=UPI0025495F38|nr:ATPase AAA-type core [Penicillium soppii]KAJ5882298.1 ATPase AAA-type core [Penicillium soppii]